MDTFSSVSLNTVLVPNHENVIWHSAEGNQSQAQEHVCYHLSGYGES